MEKEKEKEKRMDEENETEMEMGRDVVREMEKERKTLSQSLVL